MVTAGILPFRENSHGRTGNRTRDLMISSQRLWPLDHEAGPYIYRIRAVVGFIVTYAKCNCCHHTDVEVATVIVFATFQDPALQLTQMNSIQCTVAAPVTSFPGTSSSAPYLDGCQYSCSFRLVVFLRLLCTSKPVRTVPAQGQNWGSF